MCMCDPCLPPLMGYVHMFGHYLLPLMVHLCMCDHYLPLLVVGHVYIYICMMVNGHHM